MTILKVENLLNASVDNSLFRLEQNKTEKQNDGFVKALNDAQIKAAESEAEDVKLKKTCKDMEALFLNMMLGAMRKTVPENTLHNSQGEKIMRSLLDQELANNMAGAGGIGIGAMLYKQLSKANSRSAIKAYDEQMQSKNN